MRISVHNNSPELFTVKLESPSRRRVKHWALEQSFPIDMRDDGSLVPRPSSTPYPERKAWERGYDDGSILPVSIVFFPRIILPKSVESVAYPEGALGAPHPPPPLSCAAKQ